MNKEGGGDTLKGDIENPSHGGNFIFLLVLKFELRASCLLGRCSAL
jgi:hypothetical protein